MDEATQPTPPCGDLSVLQAAHAARRAALEAERLRALAALRRALEEIAPGCRVYVYGSVLRPGRYRSASDVDIAFVDEPAGKSLYRVQGELTDRVGCEVDVSLLSETRLAPTIEREGELWTL